MYRPPGNCSPVVQRALFQLVAIFYQPVEATKSPIARRVDDLACIVVQQHFPASQSGNPIEIFYWRMVMLLEDNSRPASSR